MEMILPMRLHQNSRVEFSRVTNSCARCFTWNKFEHHGVISGIPTTINRCAVAGILTTLVQFQPRVFVLSTASAAPAQRTTRALGASLPLAQCSNLPVFPKARDATYPSVPD